MTDVLFVVSAADHWTLQDGTRHPTGFWAEELVEPYTHIHRGRLHRAVDERFGELVRHFVESDKIGATVCHAPAAPLPAFASGGR
ncbi:hypothetical protein EV641_104243 [Rhodococcus sp. SMB37]|nr:hypothetical protein EV641_104243 [Rhodococcus sp. SMB37]